MGHAGALERHAAHRAQLAEVVEQHRARLNNKQQLEQQRVISSTRRSVSTTIQPTPSSGNITEKDQTLESSTPKLSGLQKDVIDNLELIAELVKQVLVLDERATNILIKHKPEEY